MKRSHPTRLVYVGLLAATMVTSACAPAASPGAPGASPGAPVPGGPLPPPATGCPLANASFCETFEGARNSSGNRNGDLSTVNFSASRWRSELDDQPRHIERARIPSCRSGASTTPLPPGDSLICDPTNAIRSRYALTAAAAQNYGDISYRIAQPFDVSNRTGTITFDASLHNEGTLVGWATLAFTAEPYSAPSYLADNSGGPTPREGVQVHFNAVCASPAGWTVFPQVRAYARHRETLLTDQNSGCPGISTGAGRLNRVQVRISRSRVEIWASDASSDGVQFGSLKKLYSTSLNLSFSRGYVSFGVHNHATEKYAGLPSWTVLWDNIAFDGPQLPRDLVSQIKDAAVPSGGGVNLGYWLPSSTGSAASFALPNVTATGASRARLLFNMAADPGSNPNWGAWRVNYRLNGRAWHAVGFSADEQALMSRAGSYSFSIPVDPREMVNGTNTVQLSGTGFYAGYQPFVGNIDLLVS